MCFSDVIPAYHMNKRHWNSLIVEGDLPMGEIQRQIDQFLYFGGEGLKNPFARAWKCVMVRLLYTAVLRFKMV